MTRRNAKLKKFNGTAHVAPRDERNTIRFTNSSGETFIIDLSSLSEPEANELGINWQNLHDLGNEMEVVQNDPDIPQSSQTTTNDTDISQSSQTTTNSDTETELAESTGFFVTYFNIHQSSNLLTFPPMLVENVISLHMTHGSCTTK